MLCMWQAVGMIHFRDKNSLPVTHVRVNIDEKRDSAKNVLDHLIYVYTCILTWSGIPKKFFNTWKFSFKFWTPFGKYRHIYIFNWALFD